jgi:hypothetical protein
MQIALATTGGEREACARIMADSDPWVTLGIGFDRALATVSQPDRELYVASADGGVAGFALISMQGVLRGYLQTIGVAVPFRGHGCRGATARPHRGPHLRRDAERVPLPRTATRRPAR